MEPEPAEILRRRFRRRYSLYNSTSFQSESATNASNLIYAAQLNNEKMNWIQFQKDVLNEKKKPKVPIKCDENVFNVQLNNYCSQAINMEKFAADTKEFTAKADTYANMEKYHREKLAYIENMIKENVDEIMTKKIVDHVMEKIHLQ